MIFIIKNNFLFFLFFIFIGFGFHSCTELGCMDSAAENYNPSATEDDGSCTYERVISCSDPEYHCLEIDFNHYIIYRAIDPSLALPFINPDNCNINNNCLQIAVIEDQSIIEFTDSTTTGLGYSYIIAIQIHALQ